VLYCYNTIQHQKTHCVILLQYNTAPTDALCYIVTIQDSFNRSTVLYCYKKYSTNRSIVLYYYNKIEHHQTHCVILLQYNTAPTDALCYIVTIKYSTNRRTVLYCYNKIQHHQTHCVILLQYNTAPTDALFCIVTIKYSTNRSTVLYC
jgi:hypothetical protein